MTLNQSTVSAHAPLGRHCGAPSMCISLYESVSRRNRLLFCDTCLSSLTACPGSWETIWTPQLPLCCSFSKSQLPLLEGKGAGNATVLDSLLEGRKEVPCQCSTNSWLKITFFIFFLRKCGGEFYRADGLNLSFSKCGPWTNSNNITWEFVKMQICKPQPKFWGWGSTICILTSTPGNSHAS